MWYRLSFEKFRESLRYEGRSLEEIAEKIIGDGYAGDPLFGLEIRLDASDEDLVAFKALFGGMSERPDEIKKREYERRIDAVLRPGLAWALSRYKQELPYLNQAGIQRAQKQAFKYLEDRFSELDLPNLNESREKYTALLQEEISKCHGA